MNWGSIWGHIDRIEGLLTSSYSVERWLFDKVRDLPDGATILEIGAWLGRSTSCLAFGCVGTKKHVYTIDTFCGNDTDFIREKSFFSAWEANMRECGVLDYVTPLRGLSSAFYETWDKPIHFLFIDGGHDLEVVMGDFDAFYPHVVSGGCIAMHDVAGIGKPIRHHPGCYLTWHEHGKAKLRNTSMVPMAHGWRE